MGWLSLFLALAATGILGVLAFTSRKMGRYFFKFHIGLALLVLLAAFLVDPPFLGAEEAGRRARTEDAAWVLTGVLGIASLAAIRGSESPFSRFWLYLPLPPAIVAVGLAARGLPVPDGVPWELAAVHLASSAALLGAVLVAMLLGHWYLSQATLSFDHLVRVNRQLLFALVVRAATIGTILSRIENPWRGLEMFDLLGIFVRFGIGLLGGGILAFLAYRCARLESNQSATGILYGAVVLVFLGEAFSLYSTVDRGLPF